jgi:hypothetical protein
VSFTYSTPWAPRDYVRFLIQDTNGSSPLFQDEELDSLLSQWGNDPRLAAAEGLESLAGLYARNAINYSVTGFSMNRTQVYKAILDRAAALRKEALSVPFEFETVADVFIDTAGVDRSNYDNTQPDGTEPAGIEPIL